MERQADHRQRRYFRYTIIRERPELRRFGERHVGQSLRSPNTIMGHHLEAILLKGPFDVERAKFFGLRPIPISAEITMFPLCAEYVDYWSEKLGMSGWVAKVPLLNSTVVHHLVNQIADNPLFALIETDYAGGRGRQSAAVYQGAVEVMRPEGTTIGLVHRTKGPINKGCGC